MGVQLPMLSRAHVGRDQPMKQEWRCNQCNMELITHVKLSEPPTCANNHSNKQMTEKGKRNDNKAVLD